MSTARTIARWTPFAAALAAASCTNAPREPRALPWAHEVLGAHRVAATVPAEIRSADDRLEGFLVEQTFPDRAGTPVQRWEIRDPDGLVVGFVDALGRAYRLEPFDDPRHVATDALPRAVGAVLALPAEASRSVRIVPAAAALPSHAESVAAPAVAVERDALPGRVASATEVGSPR